MNLLAINNIYDFQDFFTGVKTKQLKEICKQHRIKLSRQGRINKCNLLGNIYEYIFGINSLQHNREHIIIIINMSFK